MSFSVDHYTVCEVVNAEIVNVVDAIKFNIQHFLQPRQSAFELSDHHNGTVGNFLMFLKNYQCNMRPPVTLSAEDF